MSVHDAEQEYTVRLDMSKLPAGDNKEYAETIAEALIRICGFVKVWDDPNSWHRVFYVKEFPKDVSQAGIHWISVELPKMQPEYEMNRFGEL